MTLFRGYGRERKAWRPHPSAAGGQDTGLADPESNLNSCSIWARRRSSSRRRTRRLHRRYRAAEASTAVHRIEISTCSRRIDVALSLHILGLKLPVRDELAVCEPIATAVSTAAQRNSYLSCDRKIFQSAGNGQLRRCAISEVRAPFLCAARLRKLWILIGINARSEDG